MLEIIQRLGEVVLRPEVLRVGIRERLERGAHLTREELRLFPGREVPALLRHVVVNEVVVRALHPVLRRLEDLVGKHRVGDGERQVRRRILERRSSALCLLPVNPRGRRRGVRQPVQRDVVDDMVAGEVARRLSVEEGVGDLLVAVRVVVEHPGGETEW